jgi:hypothetical protein
MPSSAEPAVLAAEVAVAAGASAETPVQVVPGAEVVKAVVVEAVAVVAAAAALVAVVLADRAAAVVEAWAVHANFLRNLRIVEPGRSRPIAIHIRSAIPNRCVLPNNSRFVPELSG